MSSDESDRTLRVSTTTDETHALTSTPMTDDSQLSKQSAVSAASQPAAPVLLTEGSMQVATSSSSEDSDAAMIHARSGSRRSRKQRSSKERIREDTPTGTKKTFTKEKISKTPTKSPTPRERITGGTSQAPGGSSGSYVRSSCVGVAGEVKGPTRVSERLLASELGGSSQALGGSSGSSVRSSCVGVAGGVKGPIRVSESLLTPQGSGEPKGNLSSVSVRSSCVGVAGGTEGTEPKAPPEAKARLPAPGVRSGSYGPARRPLSAAGSRELLPRGEGAQVARQLTTPRGG